MAFHTLWVFICSHSILLYRSRMINGVCVSYCSYLLNYWVNSPKTDFERSDALIHDFFHSAFFSPEPKILTLQTKKTMKNSKSSCLTSLNHQVFGIFALKNENDHKSFHLLSNICNNQTSVQLSVRRRRMSSFKVWAHMLWKEISRLYVA